MGQDSQNTTVMRMQNILRIAHSLKEATAPFGSPSHSIQADYSLLLSDFVDLPCPSPLLPSLLETGVNHEIASAASEMYLRHAEQLKRCIQESIATVYRKAAEIPTSTSILTPDLLARKLASVFTKVYIQRLQEWKEETIQRVRQAQKTKTSPRNSRAFNHEYTPLLERFFEENPFPTYADKMFLAKKSNMQYRQIHVWFQNRRNRTKKEGKTLRRKPICEGPSKPLNGPRERIKGCMMFDCGVSKAGGVDSSAGATETVVAKNNMTKNVFASSSLPHTFPSTYPPICDYDPFPCKGGSVHFNRPEWRRVPTRKLSLPISISIDDLVERFSQLNVRDEIRSEGSSKLSHAATAAIAVTPSCAPHPSLIVRKSRLSTSIVQHYPMVRAPVSIPKAFQSPDPASKPVTLVPLSDSLHRSELPSKRKIAPLPRRIPSQMHNTCRDTTSESSSTSSILSPIPFPDFETPCGNSPFSSLAGAQELLY